MPRGGTRDDVTGIPFSWIALRAAQLIEKNPALPGMRAMIVARAELNTTWVELQYLREKKN